MESEGCVSPWLALKIEDRCPGFLEEDSRYSAQHPHEGFLTPVGLGFWIDDHVFAFARNGGWFNAIAYYAVREPRYQRANVCWSQSVERWRQARPIRYPSLKEWLADAGKCDDTANLLPEIREQRQCFKLVSSERLEGDVARYLDWEALLTGVALRSGAARRFRTRWFGVVPGIKYGWPKDILHWSGIQESILGVCGTTTTNNVI